MPCVGSAVALDADVTMYYFFWGGGVSHIAIFAHNKSDIAHQDESRQPKTASVLNTWQSPLNHQKGTPPAVKAATKMYHWLPAT
jgi:hypothetical protein